MEKSLKTIEVVEAYQLLGNAKYHKLGDEDKIKVWKISRLLKPIAVQAEEAQQDAMKSLVPDEFKQKVRVAEKYKQEKSCGKPTSMTDEEYQVYLEEFKRYNQLVGQALEEILQKEITLEFEPLAEDVIGLLIACNDWPMSKVDRLEWMIG